MKKKIEIEPALYQELEKDAFTYGMTASEFMEYLIIEYLAELEISAANE